MTWDYEATVKGVVVTVLHWYYQFLLLTFALLLIWHTALVPWLAFFGLLAFLFVTSRELTIRDDPRLNTMIGLASTGLRWAPGKDIDKESGNSFALMAVALDAARQERGKCVRLITADRLRHLCNILFLFRRNWYSTTTNSTATGRVFSPRFSDERTRGSGYKRIEKI